MDTTTEVLAEVRRDIAELERQMAMLRAVEGYLARRFHSPAIARSTSNGHTQDSIHASTKTKPKPYKEMGQREAAIQVMKQHGEAMRCPDIARQMIAGGFEYASVPKLANALYTSFARGPSIFRKAGVGLWELVPQPDVVDSE